jgi:hypothetical protein
MYLAFAKAGADADHSQAAVEFAAIWRRSSMHRLPLIAVNTPVSEGRGGSHPPWDDPQFGKIAESAKTVTEQNGATGAGLGCRWARRESPLSG